MTHPDPKAIKEFLDYMTRFESFCLMSRASLFPPPSDEKLGRIRDVFNWLQRLSEGAEGGD